MNFRGTKNKLVWTSCVVVSLLLDGTYALAVQKPSKKEMQGPSQQEYYSTASRSISPEDRAKANKLRVQTIDSIKSLLSQKNVKGSRRFELLLREGELYSEMHDYTRDEELSDFETRFDAWEKAGSKGKAPTPNYKKSKGQLANAADAFRKLVREFPKHPRTAAALYSLGKTLARLEDDGSIVYFRQLIRDHKTSPLVSDTYLSMGDFYFEKHDMDKAVDNYKKFMKYKEHPAYPYGVYKLGWAFYNSTPKNDADAKDNIDKAVTSFKLAVKLSDTTSKTRRYRINLRQEGIKDLIMVWAETEDTDAAWAYFKTIGEKKSFYDLLDRLGEMYANQGKNAQAIAVYTRLVSEAPTREGNHRIYEKLLSMYDAQGRYQKVVDTLDEMDKNFVKSSAWTKANGKDASLLAEAKTLVEFNMHRYGTMYHNRGQKTKSKDLMASALKIYGLHLDSFSESKNAYEIRYYFADLLFEFGKYESAAEQYTKVADLNPKGKYVKDAAMNAVVALNKLDVQTKYDKLPPAGQVPKPIPLPKTKVKLVAALDKYVALMPKDKNGDPMRFTAAQIYFEYGAYPEAMTRFEKIITEIPGTKQAEASLKLTLAYQADRKDYDKTIAMSRRYLAQKSLKKEMRDYIVGLMKNAMYNQAMGLEKEQKYEEAAKAFVAFHKEFHWDKSSGDKALYNASVNYYKAGMLEDALAVNIKMTEGYPDSELTPNAVVNIAQTYEALLQYEKAARFYEQYAVRYPKNENASKALYNAATLYKGLNRPADAERLYARFVQYYPYNKILNDVRMEVARLQEKQGRFKSSAATYKAVFEGTTKPEDADIALLAGAKAALTVTDHIDPKEGAKMFATVRGRLRGNHAPAAFEARQLVAEALFKGLETDIAAYKQIKLVDAKTVEADVRKKQARLEQLAKRYEDVMSVDNPEYVVASLYRLGELHEDFAEGLFNVPTPAGANQVEVSQFKSSIEKVAFPLKEEAYKFYETAFKRSQEVETFTAWTRRTYDKMAQLAPEKNPEVLEQEAEPAYMAHKVIMEPAVSALAH